MKTSVYRDLIDEKVSEWRAKLEKLEGIQKEADPKEKLALETTIKNLQSKLDGAIADLDTLDKSESVENTVETKDKILAIFSSLDKDFPSVDSKTPYML